MQENLNTITEKDKTTVLSEIELVNNEGEFYKSKSIYQSMVNIFKEGKSKMSVGGLGNCALDISNDKMLFSCEGEGIVITGIPIYQYPIVTKKFTPELEKKIIEKFEKILNINEDTSRKFLNLVNINNVLNYQYFKNDDKKIESYGGEEIYKKMQAIIRTVLGHNENITFRIGAQTYFIVPDKLQINYPTTRQLESFDENHVQSENYATDGKENVERKFIYCKKDKYGKLSSVSDSSKASLNYYSYSVMVQNFDDNGKKGLKKVGFIYKIYEAPSNIENRNIVDTSKDEELDPDTLF